MDVRVYMLPVALSLFATALLCLAFSVARMRRGRMESGQPRISDDFAEGVDSASGSKDSGIPAAVVESLPDQCPTSDGGAVSDVAVLCDPWAVLVADLERKEGKAPPLHVPQIAPTLDSKRAEEIDMQAQDYVMISPVEIWFGESRVGVRPGTATFLQFQRFASELFKEFEKATQPS